MYAVNGFQAYYTAALEEFLGFFSCGIFTPVISFFANSSYVLHIVFKFHSPFLGLVLSCQLKYFLTIFSWINIAIMVGYMREVSRNIAQAKRII